MKLAFMQNNDEQIFDGYLRGKLESATPDMALLDSSFNTFLLERKDKKKKRRWFFWFFLLLPFFIIPIGYYVVSTKSDLTNSNRVNNKENTTINTKDTSSFLNAETNEQENATDSAFIKQNKVSNSIQFDVADKSTIKDVDKLQQKNFTSQPSETQNNNRNDKTLSSDSAVSSNNILQKNVSKALDSVMKKKDKTAAKADTFYIVW